MADILIKEAGNGGDLVLLGNDLAAASGYENGPYLSMFGGDAWWGNAFLQDEEPSVRFSSQTERTLREVPLNSAGRIRIEAAINADLAWLRDISGTTVAVATTITSDNRLDINITINGRTFYYQWNPGADFLTYRV